MRLQVVGYYYIGFIVEERIGCRRRRMTPALSIGAKGNSRLEAQFYFGQGLRATAARVCAFVWGNTGVHSDGKVEDFQTFQEFGTPASDKTYDAHHLSYKGGPPAPWRAVPGEVIIASKYYHKQLHKKMGI